MTDQFSTYDAAYLLGALPPADRSVYEEHLAECSDCRRAVNELAGLPGLLASLTADQAKAAGDLAPEMPPTLLPRLMEEVQRTRFRRRFTTALVGMAAAVVFMIALVAGLHGAAPAGDGDDAGKAPLALTMTPVSDSVPIRATARLVDEAWGTQIVVRCIYQASHAAGDHYPLGSEGPTYTMVVIDTSGGHQQVASWEAKPGAPIVVDGSTSLPSAQIASIEVHDQSHRTILGLKL